MIGRDVVGIGVGGIWVGIWVGIGVGIVFGTEVDNIQVSDVLSDLLSGVVVYNCCGFDRVLLLREIILIGADIA